MLLWQWLQWLLETGERTAIAITVLLYFMLFPPDFSGLFKGLEALLLGMFVAVMAGMLCVGIVGLTAIFAGSICIANWMNRRTCA